MSAERMLLQYATLMEKYLDQAISNVNCLQSTLIEAMRYSLLDGGKRIRPALTLEFCRLCGGNINDAIPFACAVEMIHSYSLVHDDLPCLDNDTMRRGKLSNHARYGEAMALLAGDGLLTLAFETALKSKIDPGRTVKAAHALANAAGYTGMVGGQVIDLKSEGKKVDIDTLKSMHQGKTGAIIIAAAQMGCIVAGADERQLAAGEAYARYLGLAFQITDDILDVIGDTAILGKSVGKDSLNNKSTYVTLFGLKKAQEMAMETTQKAIHALEIFGDGAGDLRELAVLLAQRKK